MAAVEKREADVVRMQNGVRFGRVGEGNQQFAWILENRPNKECDECGKTAAKIDFYIQAPSYYRCRAGNHYFFCSENCVEKFRDTKTCRGCGYDERLKEHKGYMLCIDNPMDDLSCYEKIALGKKKTDRCIFCYEYLENKRRVWEDDDSDIPAHICKWCFLKYERIVLFKFKKIGDDTPDEDPEDEDAEEDEKKEAVKNDQEKESCFFCDRDGTKTLGEVNLCNRCTHMYRKMTRVDQGFDHDFKRE